MGFRTEECGMGRLVPSVSYRIVIVWLQDFHSLSQKSNESEILLRVEHLAERFLEEWGVRCGGKEG